MSTYQITSDATVANVRQITARRGDGTVICVAARTPALDIAGAHPRVNIAPFGWVTVVDPWRFGGMFGPAWVLAFLQYRG